MSISKAHYARTNAALTAENEYLRSNINVSNNINTKLLAELNVLKTKLSDTETANKQLLDTIENRSLLFENERNALIISLKSTRSLLAFTIRTMVGHIKKE